MANLRGAVLPVVRFAGKCSISRGSRAPTRARSCSMAPPPVAIAVEAWRALVTIDGSGVESTIGGTRRRTSRTDRRRLSGERQSGRREDRRRQGAARPGIREARSCSGLMTARSAIGAPTDQRLRRRSARPSSRSTSLTRSMRSLSARSGEHPAAGSSDGRAARRQGVRGHDGAFASSCCPWCLCADCSASHRPPSRKRAKKSW